MILFVFANNILLRAQSLLRFYISQHHKGSNLVLVLLYISPSWVVITVLYMWSPFTAFTLRTFPLPLPWWYTVCAPVQMNRTAGAVCRYHTVFSLNCLVASNKISSNIYLYVYLAALAELAWGGLSAYGWCRWDLHHKACPEHLLEAHGEATTLWQTRDPLTRGRTWTFSHQAVAPCRRGLGKSPERKVKENVIFGDSWCTFHSSFIHDWQHLRWLLLLLLRSFKF